LETAIVCDPKECCSLPLNDHWAALQDIGLEDRLSRTIGEDYQNIQQI